MVSEQSKKTNVPFNSKIEREKQIELQMQYGPGPGQYQHKSMAFRNEYIRGTDKERRVMS